MRMQELTNVTYGRWPGILVSLGADNKYLGKMHGPCPFCGGKDRYNFKDDGVGKWFCNQCGYGDGWDYLSRLHGWDLRRTMTEVETIVGTVPKVTPQAKDSRELARYMKEIWRGARKVEQGDPVWLYLNNRGLIATPPSELRYHPALKHSVDGGCHPAMVARMVTPDGMRATGLHRTYLTPEGKKANVDPVRMTLGEIGTIRLGEPRTALGIAEGIETALGGSKRFGTIVWAATCAHGLESWTPPPGTTRVEVYGDCDASYTGQAAAYALAKRLVREGLAVVVRIPSEMGTDWADLVVRP